MDEKKLEINVMSIYDDNDSAQDKVNIYAITI